MTERSPKSENPYDDPAFANMCVQSALMIRRPELWDEDQIERAQQFLDLFGITVETSEDNVAQYLMHGDQIIANLEW